MVGLLLLPVFLLSRYKGFLFSKRVKFLWREFPATVPSSPQ